MAEVQSTKRAQEAETVVNILTKKMKDLEIEFGVLKHQIIDTQALIQQKALSLLYTKLQWSLLLIML